MLKYSYIWILLFVVGCGGTSATPTPEILEEQFNNLTIQLAPQQPPQINTRQEWLITLRDGTNQPLEGADVFLDLDMPAMAMGENMPQATEEAPGIYRASGSYTMSGEWIVAVHAIIDGIERVATFPVTVP